MIIIHGQAYESMDYCLISDPMDPISLALLYQVSCVLEYYASTHSTETQSDLASSGVYFHSTNSQGRS